MQISGQMKEEEVGGKYRDKKNKTTTDKKALGNMKNGKAARPGNIPTELLK